MNEVADVFAFDDTSSEHDTDFYFHPCLFLLELSLAPFVLLVIPFLFTGDSILLCDMSIKDHA